MRLGLLALLALAGLMLSLGCGGGDKPAAAQNSGSAGVASTPVPTPTLGIAPTAVISPVAAYLKPLNGTWVGIVYQEDFDPYLVVINIAGEQLKVEYPDQSCSGSLSAQNLEGDLLTLREHIEVDPDGNCNDNGVVHLRPDPRGLYWDWFYPDGSQDSDPVILIRR